MSPTTPTRGTGLQTVSEQKVEHKTESPTRRRPEAAGAPTLGTKLPPTPGRVKPGPVPGTPPGPGPGTTPGPPMPPIPVDRREVLIRQANRADEPFLREMAVAVFTEFGDYRQSLREWLREQTVVSRIAATPNGPVGFYMMEIFPGPRSHLPGRRGAMIAYLLAVGVLPQHQRRGIGKLLMVDAMAQINGTRPAVAEVRLSVAEGNLRARRLFAQHGFQDGGLDQRLYENGQQALLMRMSL